MEELTFYDLKAKKKFKSSDYKITKKGNRSFAICTAPSGIKSYRIVSSK